MPPSYVASKRGRGKKGSESPAENYQRRIIIIKTLLAAAAVAPLLRLDISEPRADDEQRETKKGRTSRRVTPAPLFVGRVVVPWRNLAAVVCRRLLLLPLDSDRVSE